MNYAERERQRKLNKTNQKFASVLRSNNQPSPSAPRTLPIPPEATLASSKPIEKPIYGATTRKSQIPVLTSLHSKPVSIPKSNPSQTNPSQTAGRPRIPSQSNAPPTNKRYPVLTLPYPLPPKVARPSTSQETVPKTHPYLLSNRTKQSSGITGQTGPISSQPTPSKNVSGRPVSSQQTPGRLGAKRPISSQQTPSVIGPKRPISSQPTPSGLGPKIPVLGRPTPSRFGPKRQVSSKFGASKPISSQSTVPKSTSSRLKEPPARVNPVAGPPQRSVGTIPKSRTSVYAAYRTNKIPTRTVKTPNNLGETSVKKIIETVHTSSTQESPEGIKKIKTVITARTDSTQGNSGVITGSGTGRMSKEIEWIDVDLLPDIDTKPFVPVRVKEEKISALESPKISQIYVPESNVDYFNNSISEWKTGRNTKQNETRASVPVRVKVEKMSALDSPETSEMYSYVPESNLNYFNNTLTAWKTGRKTNEDEWIDVDALPDFETRPFVPVRVKKEKISVSDMGSTEILYVSDDIDNEWVNIGSMPVTIKVEKMSDETKAERPPFGQRFVYSSYLKAVVENGMRNSEKEMKYMEEVCGFIKGKKTQARGVFAARDRAQRRLQRFKSMVDKFYKSLGISMMETKITIDSESYDFIDNFGENFSEKIFQDFLAEYANFLRNEAKDVFFRTKEIVKDEETLDKYCRVPPVYQLLDELRINSDKLFDMSGQVREPLYGQENFFVAFNEIYENCRSTFNQMVKKINKLNTMAKLMAK